MIEQWKQITGFSDYMVSDQGRVCRVRKISPNSKGYKVIRLRRDDGSLTTLIVHRVVLSMFRGPCPEGLECRHLDGDKDNNNLDNLEWGTWAENHADAIVHGKRFMDKLTKKEITEVQQSSASIHALAKRFDVDRKTIKYHQHKNFSK